MADSTIVADEAAALPDSRRIKQAEKLTRERFVHEGETPELALAVGTARRRALDAALAEVDAGLKIPSTKWRRRYSLLLGLERVLSDDEPVLADGTLLNPHQVDALAGTLTALLATAQSADLAADDDLTVDFSQVTTERDVVTIVSTEPLTRNETWRSLAVGEALLLQRGEVTQRRLAVQAS